MEDKAGSFVVDANGNVVPNPDDEAMAERHGLKKKEKKKETGKKEEVNKDA